MNTAQSLTGNPVRMTSCDALTDGQRLQARAAFAAWARWRCFQNWTGLGYPNKTTFAKWIVNPWVSDAQISRNHTFEDCQKIDRIIYRHMSDRTIKALEVRYHIDAESPRSNSRAQQAQYLGIRRQTYDDMLAVAEEVLIRRFHALDYGTDLYEHCDNL